jgi:hypothetical protein
MKAEINREEIDNAFAFLLGFFNDLYSEDGNLSDLKEDYAIALNNIYLLESTIKNLEVGMKIRKKKLSSIEAKNFVLKEQILTAQEKILSPFEFPDGKCPVCLSNGYFHNYSCYLLKLKGGS